jgi:hypothetical protein
MPFEQYAILTRGFRNIYEGARIVGFQLNVRTMLYRGVPLSVLEGVDVTVDGETFSGNKVRYSLGKRIYTEAEAAKAGDVLWPFGDPLTLIVTKPGGLKPGIHDVQVVEKARISYHDDKENPAMDLARRKVALVI